MHPPDDLAAAAAALALADGRVILARLALAAADARRPVDHDGPLVAAHVAADRWLRTRHDAAVECEQ